MWIKGGILSRGTMKSCSAADVHSTCLADLFTHQGIISIDNILGNIQCGLQLIYVTFATCYRSVDVIFLKVIRRDAFQ